MEEKNVEGFLLLVQKPEHNSSGSLTETFFHNKFARSLEYET